MHPDSPGKTRPTEGLSQTSCDTVPFEYQDFEAASSQRTSAGEATYP
jgi:hypothetical protein